ncbi:natural killer cell receptor 2B4 [Apteryx mantelli]|uniref:Natural killer cell receptor 2B4 n=1 Tax=Apteryx mantelli TaxID=2696672 RepID=A0ABM4FWU8_9AVES
MAPAGAGHWRALLCLALLAAAAAGCENVAVAVGDELRLVPEKLMPLWESIDWRVRWDRGGQLRILTAKKNRVQRPPGSPLNQRAVFQRDTLSLCISDVTKADSGIYSVHFENTSDFEVSRNFCVSVLAPVGRPALEAHVAHSERGWCNLSLACAVPGADNITYGWSRAGVAPEALGHQPVLQLWLRGDANGTVYLCNASNAVSWATASTDVSALCSPPEFFTMELWWMLAAALGLLLGVTALVLILVRRCRRRPGPAGNAEQPLTVYEEVGKAQPSRDRNGSSEATRTGNTIYTTVCSKTLGPGRLREPESCTIYATVQPSKRSPSVKRKRIDPSLTSTAYAEPAEASRRWRAPPHTSPPAAAGHRLS